MAAKHEDQADRFGDYSRADPHNRPLCLQWVQVLRNRSCLNIRRSLLLGRLCIITSILYKAVKTIPCLVGENSF